MAIGTVRILNKHKDKVSIDDFYIGRGSILGNPYTHLNLGSTKAEIQVDTREQAIEEYGSYAKRMIKENQAFREAIVDLIHRVARGEDVNLVCFCKPQACHGDFLKELIETQASKIRTMARMDRQ